MEKIADEVELMDKLIKENKYVQALPIIKKLAEQGNATAQQFFGYLYMSATVMPQDFKEAVKWYKLSAEQGNSMAQVQLAECYNNGYGVDKNPTEALKLHIKAFPNVNGILRAYNIETIKRFMTSKVLTDILMEKDKLEKEVESDKKVIAELRERVEQLETEITYRPGGTGYTQAKEHFETVLHSR